MNSENQLIDIASPSTAQSVEAERIVEPVVEKDENTGSSLSVATFPSDAETCEIIALRSSSDDSRALDTSFEVSFLRPITGDEDTSCPKSPTLEQKKWVNLVRAYVDDEPVFRKKVKKAALPRRLRAARHCLSWTRCWREYRKRGPIRGRVEKKDRVASPSRTGGRLCETTV